MEMGELRAGWESLGKRDPMWAVLTDPAKRGGGWTRAEFLASGEAEVAAVFNRLAQLGLHPAGRVLDFGCGAGRLTQALAARFGRADGVDIAEAMLTAARDLEPPPNIAFHHNVADNLHLFPDDAFDFLYSSIVLQHMPRLMALAYIREFGRVAKPGAVIVFQVPDEYRPGPPSLIDKMRGARVHLALGTRLGGRRPSTPRDPDLATLAAHSTPEAMVVSSLMEAGVEVRDIVVTNSLDMDFNGHLEYSTEAPAYGWVSKQYTAVVGPGALEYEDRLLRATG